MQQNQQEFEELLAKIKALAKRYRDVRGRPLGVTGEVAECEAARLLGLALTDARNPGFDAVRTDAGRTVKLQIKGRCLLNKKSGQRIGRIDLTKKWDAVLLVLLDDDLNATEIWEAKHDKIEDALTKPGSKARNERGALSVSKFRSIGRRIWPGDDSGCGSTV
ncbi:MAG: hypothetical protein CHACPFDD_02445 [Phycisphaerae bacterium]|nr:hypothetical protein [Phycisphaerae bacterium]